MREYKLAFIGFGNVGKALAKLLLEKQSELVERYQISFIVTGIFTGHHGSAVDRSGLDINRAFAAADLNSLSKEVVNSTRDFLEKSAADVLFENSPVDYFSGQPAVDHLRWALEFGMHAITANKGPVVHAYRDLTEIARQRGKKFLFESTVMDGAPIFSLFREALPGLNLKAFRGILNSTTNMILTLIEQGKSFDQAVQHCQEIGIAETDPSGDIDGWDAAVKVAALATVLMGVPLKPIEVMRTGIRGLDPEKIIQAQVEGKRWKLVCSARRSGDHVEANVAPEMVESDSPMYGVCGTTSIIQFETDSLGLLSVVESDPGPHTTAYGLFADFLNAVRLED